MNVPEKAWIKYIERLSKINEAAAGAMQKFLDAYNIADDAGRKALLNAAYTIVTQFGDGASAVACEMYDAMSKAAGLFLPPAEPAPEISFGEVARAINGTLKQYAGTSQVATTVGRMVKQSGQDTTLQNAIRDGAEFAWIPHGDTCAFCLTLASRGWQRASKKILKNGHAEHIHANCDCAYGIRFDKKTTYDGYNPDKYLEMYRNAEGDTPAEKINAMRRQQYAADKDAINEQKRMRYVENKLLQHRGRGYDVLKEYLADAEPGRGNIDYETGFDPSKSVAEEQTAKILFDNFGGDIVLKEEINGQKNPDYEWLGRLWDLKSTTTEKAANSAIKAGMTQIRSNPGGIILNYENNDFSVDELRRVIDLRMSWYPRESADIMIISKGKVLSVLRY